jgi:hypothetical protein
MPWTTPSQRAPSPSKLTTASHCKFRWLRTNSS